MNCSLTKYYAFLASAIGLLSAAVIAAYYANIPSLSLAIALVVVATIFLPLIKDEMKAYAQCRGPSSVCNMGPNIDLLGVAAGFISGISFGLALSLQIGALAFIWIWFLAWIGVSMQAASAFFIASGIVSCLAAIGVLIGLQTNVSGYVGCKDTEDQSAIPPPRP